MIIPQIMQTRERVRAVMTWVIADKPAEVKSQAVAVHSSKMPLADRRHAVPRSRYGVTGSCRRLETSSWSSGCTRSRDRLCLCGQECSLLCAAVASAHAQIGQG